MRIGACWLDEAPGLEMACRLKIGIWFCDRQAAWQRGADENTNGLLRPFLPKGSDLSQYSQRDLNQIAKRPTT